MPVETLCEIEAAAKGDVKYTPPDKKSQTTRKYLKYSGLLALPFNKGVPFGEKQKNEKS